MVSSVTRNRVWQEFFDQARLVRYYEALSDRYRREHSIVSFLLVAAAGSAIAAFLDLLPQWVQLIANILVALLVAFDLVIAPARKAAVLHTISTECSRLEIEFKELWDETNATEASDNEIRRKLSQLDHRVLEVTSRAGDASIRENPKLNEQCEATAKRVMKEQYG